MNDKVRKVREAAIVIQSTTGFTLGLYLFVYGLYFYEKFGGANNPNALLWTTLVFVISKAVVLCCDIPTGAIADYFGRRKVVTAGFAFQGIYFLLLAILWFVDTPVWGFVLATIAYGIFGIGYSLLNGSFLAWVVDSLHAQKLPEGHGPILVDSYRFYFMAQLLGTVISLTLYSMGLIFYAFGLGFISCVVCCAYCYFVMEESEHMKFYDGPFRIGDAVAGSLQKMKEGFHEMLHNLPVLFLAITNACFMFMVFVVTFLWPVAMQAQFGFGKFSPSWYAISIGTIVVGYFGARYLKGLLASHKQRGEVVPNLSLMKWLAVGCCTAALPVALFAVGAGAHLSFFGSFPLLVASVVFTYGGYGFLRPCYETLINNYLHGVAAQRRATVLSVGSTFASLMAIIFMIPSGKGSDSASPVGWLLPAGMLCVAALVTAAVVWRNERKVHKVNAEAICSD